MTFKRLRRAVRGLKTILFGVAFALISFWDSLAMAGVDITPLLPPDYAPFIMSGAGVAIVLLRFATKGPVRWHRNFRHREDDEQC